MTELYWLPQTGDWGQTFEAARRLPPDQAWSALVGLARCRVDFTRTEKLARAIRKLCGTEPPGGLAAPPVRLALLGSSTIEHLVPAVRVAGLRRNIWIDVHTGGYGQYLHELSDTASALHAFAPTAVLFALDARHLVGGAAATGEAQAADAALDRTLDRLGHAWTMARDMGAMVFQQTAMPVFPALLGFNEHRLGWSPRRLVATFNQRVRERADAAGVDLLSLDEAVEHHGLGAWHDPANWHRAKQEVYPAATPYYGDLVGRALASRLGRSSKCLVLDLDNTLWGGVIGDDGLEGIALGQGSTAGEAHVALQSYAKDLSKRGIILAVCSKNDEANALEPFEKHPEMILKRSDIACFVANWQDKATNLRAIAAALNIGIDSLVFVDDNPFERNIIRRELPMVEVPELPEDPTTYVNCVADAGYFETPAVTAEDAQRAAQYQDNAKRARAMTSATDMGAYLASLDMTMRWRPFDAIGATRIAQLINKSNQFNLTTRRYSEDEVTALIGDRRAVTLQLRLIDAFGDNGMISVVIARPGEGDAMDIDTWLMSCRVLGREVEQAALNLLVAEAQAIGAGRLVGHYRPTAKNGMVADHYGKLGFALVERNGNGSSRWALDLASYAPASVHITTIRD